MVTEGKQSNYEITKANMASVFLRHNQAKMIQKFGLAHNTKYLFVHFIGRDYRIDRSTGAVNWSENGFQTEVPASHNEVMTIYDVLCCPKDAPKLAGQWVNVASLSPIRGGTLSKGSFFENAGSAFDGKAEQLGRACEELKGRKLKKGDVAYELDMFPFLPIALHFWNSDEDFPASLQIFVDQNILDFMHYETLMFAIIHLLDLLKEKCGAT